MKDSVTPRINVPHQIGPGDIVDIGFNAKIGRAANVKGVHGNEDSGFLPELDRVERDVPTVFGL